MRESFGIIGIVCVEDVDSVTKFGDYFLGGWNLFSRKDKSMKILNIKIVETVPHLSNVLFINAK